MFSKITKKKFELVEDYIKVIYHTALTHQKNEHTLGNQWLAQTSIRTNPTYKKSILNRTPSTLRSSPN